MSVKLKPCPFCGSEDLEIKQVIQDSWMIHCHQCHAAVQFLKNECWSSKTHAVIDSWNQRAEADECQ